MNTKHILVVDDIKDTLAGTLADLVSQGVDVDHVTNVADALLHLRNKKYDVMLLDWRLPSDPGSAIYDEAGGELLDQLKSGKAGKVNRQIAVIVFTAHRTGVDLDKIKKFARCQVLSKMRVRDLDEQLRKIFSVGK